MTLNSELLAAFGRGVYPSPAGGRWLTTTQPSISAVGHVPLAPASAGVRNSELVPLARQKPGGWSGIQNSEFKTHDSSGRDRGATP